MLIKSIRDVAQFIFNWTGESSSYPGGPNRLAQHLPEPIRILDELLGSFWGPQPYPFLPGEHDHNTNRGLFHVQDSIVNPRGTSLTDGNITLLLDENQGVWSVGYTKNHKLMIKGDWVWSGDVQTHLDWSPFDANIEDVLIFALLINFYFYAFSDKIFIDMDFNDPDSREPYSLLWSHPAWSAFPGFFTDTDGKILVFSGFGAIQHPLKLIN